MVAIAVRVDWTTGVGTRVGCFDAVLVKVNCRVVPSLFIVVFAIVVVMFVDITIFDFPPSPWLS